MIELRQTPLFTTWLRRLRDPTAVARITTRLDRLRLGHRGDAKSVGDGVSELRIHHGPGYRLYLTERGGTVVVLLCGGDKSSQERDIRTAQALAKEV